MSSPKRANPIEQHYREERWGTPLRELISVRVTKDMAAALTARAVREGVDVSTLCRRYLSLAAIEEDLNIEA